MQLQNLTQVARSKRKRIPINDESSSRRPMARPTLPPAAVSTSVPPINFCVKARTDKLDLVDADAETFSTVLGIIDEYDGVLQRHESLAANLGSKLISPILLKSFEKLFDGPVKIVHPTAGFEPSVGWLDVVKYARSNPSKFTLDEFSPGVVSCKVWIKSVQVEVSENDFLLIMSGEPERVIPPQPIPGDVKAELEAVAMVEARLAVLIKKADTVAIRARQLNYNLEARKTAILGTNMVDHPPEIIDLSQESRDLGQRCLNKTPQPNMSYQPPSTPYPSMPSSPNIERAHLATPAPGANPIRCSAPTRGSEKENIAIMQSRIIRMTPGDFIYPPCDRCRRLRYKCTKQITACTPCSNKHVKCHWNLVENGELDNRS
ncbi:hypothetical protein BJ875DRAFT_376302 [Amylocarpus encephaloides]|uniref:Zn(2)-C6 fungal-type domain-containing protein n=1 Tax=Amylocarpus encephaloides TaxID=45428 RepID=A0A9P7YJA1_9HELO|nr:hypothetical protein BJ875DRAFT_376302 [Amylocarpus encephaloides]